MVSGAVVVGAVGAVVVGAVVVGAAVVGAVVVGAGSLVVPSCRGSSGAVVVLVVVRLVACVPLSSTAPLFVVATEVEPFQPRPEAR